MVRILYSLALFVTREVDRLFPSIEHHIYISTGFLLFLLTQIDKSRHPALLVPTSVPVSKRSPFSFSTHLYKARSLFTSPQALGGALLHTFGGRQDAVAK